MVNLKLLSTVSRAFRLGATVLGLMIASMACTGGKNDLPTGSGSIRITPGEALSLDLQDVVALNVKTFNVSIKTVSPDYQTFTEVFDLTAEAKANLDAGVTTFSYTLPKNVTPPKPFVIVVDIPSIQDYLVDVIFEGQTTSRPGVASKLAFDLIDSFNTDQVPKALNQYSITEFTGIKTLIQTRIDQVTSQSEHLSFSSVPFAKLLRFFKNSLAFNPGFLKNVDDHYGVHFKFTAQPISGVQAFQTPENDANFSACLRGFCYVYANNITVAGADGTQVPVTKNPFKQLSNTPAQMMSGVARPAPIMSAGDFIPVGEKIPQLGEAPPISVTAQGFDLDDDYMEKSMRVIYTPRRLPNSMITKTLPNGQPTYDPAREHVAEDVTLTHLSNSDQMDTYTLSSIGYDEALDPTNYTDCTDPTTCHTAYRDVFYMVTDGMAWMPYYWHFKYADTNRQPQFVLNSNRGINDTYFDAAIQAGMGAQRDVEFPAGSGTGWLKHNSHCETDGSAIPSVGPTVFYQRILSKKDSPWSCAFRVFDPDIDDDPNGAPDTFYFGVNADLSTRVFMGASLLSINPNAFPVPTPGFDVAPTFIWPPLDPYTIDNPKLIKALTETLDCPGHRRCGIGLTQVVIDNAVKQAAEKLAEQTFTYGITIFDRPLNGQSNSYQLSRKVQFEPNPPLLVNYATPSPSPFAAPFNDPAYLDLSIGQTTNTLTGELIHTRTDTYVNEIFYAAKPYNTPAPGATPDPSIVGFDLSLLDNSSTGGTNRAVFSLKDINGVPYSMSPYFTRPHALCDSSTPVDNGTHCLGGFGLTFSAGSIDPDPGNGSAGNLVILSNSLRMFDSSMFDHPHEYDNACSLSENNVGFDPPLSGTPRPDGKHFITWDQRSITGGYGGNITAFAKNLVGNAVPATYTWSFATPSPAPAARAAGGAWVFEIDAIDYDNVNLNSSEPSDPIYLSFETDISNGSYIRYCNPVTPNQDSRRGYTYSNTSTNPATNNAKDPDTCLSWDSTPPSQMQPMFVYYQGKDDVTSQKVTRKLVYHRLRVMWTPKDQGYSNKNDDLDPPGLIRNLIKNLKISGNVYKYSSIQNDRTRDKTEPFIDPVTFQKSTLPLYAERKEMKPCLTGITNNTQTKLTYENASAKPKVAFSVIDPNRVLGVDGALTGSTEAEFSLVKSTTLDDLELLKFIPYTIDCTTPETRNLSFFGINYKWNAPWKANASVSSYDVFYKPHNGLPFSQPPGGSWSQITGLTSNQQLIRNLPAYQSFDLANIAYFSDGSQLVSPVISISANVTPTPVPNATPAVANLPAVWYSSQTDASQPKIRFKSSWADTAGMCVQHLFTPALDAANIPFNAVWKISRTDMTDTSAILLNSADFQTCTGYPGYVMLPNQKHLLFGVKNLLTCQHALNSTFAIASGLQAKVAFIIDPTSTFMGGLNSPVPDVSTYRIDWFPSIYQANFGPGTTSTPDPNSKSELVFNVSAINTFKYDTDSLPTSGTYGRTTFVGFATDINGNAIPGYSNSPSTAVTADALIKYTGATPTPVPVTTPNLFDYAIRVGDTDSQPVSIAITAPTPDVSAIPAPQSFYRIKNESTMQIFSWAPIDPISTGAPLPTATPSIVQFPFKATDILTSMQATNVENDPYDVMSFALASPTPMITPTPVATPYLTKFGTRTNCTDFPTAVAASGTIPAIPAYPDASRLTQDQLKDFKQCTMNWSNYGKDGGQKFVYNLWVQDNPSSNPNATPTATPGYGGGLNIGATYMTNGPVTKFTVELYSLEVNKAPFFTSNATSTTPLSNQYGVTGSAWSNVFPASGGLKPACSGTVANKFICPTATPTKQVLNGDSSIKTNGDILWNSGTPVPLIEGTNQSFSIFVKDRANLDKLRTLSVVTPPTQVLIADGPHAGTLYSVDSFVNSKINWKPVATPSPDPLDSTKQIGTLTITFDWTPSDTEAHYLSNQGGFLIPITVTDQASDPSNGETGFPKSFISDAIKSTIWVWCTLDVVNKTPTLVMQDSLGNKGAIFSAQAGSTSPLVITASVQDFDTARWDDGTSTEQQLSFNLNFPALPSFVTVLSTSAVTKVPASGTAAAYLTQSKQIKVNPQTSDMANSPYSLSVTSDDPGDTSIGRAQNPDASVPYPRAKSQNGLLGFTLNVTGKPSFNSPPIADTSAAPPSGARVLLNNLATAAPTPNYAKVSGFPLIPFYYPMSVSISRPSERTAANSTKNFFMGIIVKGPTPTPAPTYKSLPLANVKDGAGFYVNENYILKAGNSTFGASNSNESRMINLGAIVDSGNCSSVRNRIDTTTATQYTLYRIKESVGTTGTPDYCNVNASNADKNLATVSFIHTVYANAPSLPSITSTQIDRYSPGVISGAAALTASKVNQEYQDFSKRCTYCQGINPTNNGTLTLSSGAITAFNVGGALTYQTTTSQQMSFTVNAANQITKEFQDTNPNLAPVASRKLEVTALKGEKLFFKANLSTTPAASGPRLQARWYVNGCLVDNRAIESNYAAYSMMVPNAGSGVNNDCSGQYDRGDANSDDLGMIRVRLAIVNDTEAFGTNSDGSTVGYAFNVKIINTSPFIQLTTNNLRASPIPNLSTSSVKFLLPFSGNGKNLFALTDRAGSSTTVRIREFDKSGGLNAAGLASNLGCTGFGADANWMGIAPNSSNLSVAIGTGFAGNGSSLSSAYPVSAPSLSIYGNKNNTCFNSSIPYSNGSPINAAASNTGSIQAAGSTLAYSSSVASSRGAAVWNSGSTSYLIDGNNSSSSFWDTSYPIYGISGFATQIYTSMPAAFSSYSNNIVQKNIVAGNMLVQFVGLDPSKSTNSRGFVLISDLSTSGRTVSASNTRSIEFGDTGAAGNSLCSYADGSTNPNTVYPIDGVYEPLSQTLFVLATDTNSSSVGRLYEITNLSTTPSCRFISSALAAPSKKNSEHNTSLNKLVIDSNNGLLWGAISPGGMGVGQLFSYDFISKRDPASSIVNLSFSPHSIILSPSINAVHVFSNIYNGTNPSLIPTLYRVW